MTSTRTRLDELGVLGADVEDVDDLVDELLDVEPGEVLVLDEFSRERGSRRGFSDSAARSRLSAFESMGLVETARACSGYDKDTPEGPSWGGL